MQDPTVTDQPRRSFEIPTGHDPEEQQRLRQHELDLYEAIIGRRVIIEPHKEPTSDDEQIELTEVTRKMMAWPAVSAQVCRRLSETARRGLAQRLRRAELTPWLKRMSDTMKRRVEEAQARLNLR